MPTSSARCENHKHFWSDFVDDLDGKGRAKGLCIDLVSGWRLLILQHLQLATLLIKVQ
jgi:hypothetical protein